jgi:hypothetical protein
MTTTPFVKPVGEAGSGEVLVCQEFSMGMDFGRRVRNRIMSLDDAVELLGPTVVGRFIEDLDWHNWETIRQSNKEPR